MLTRVSVGAVSDGRRRRWSLVLTLVIVCPHSFSLTLVTRALPLPTSVSDTDWSNILMWSLIHLRESVKLQIFFTCIDNNFEYEWNSLEENNKIALFLWFNEWLMGVWCALVNICFSQQSHLLRLLQLPLLHIQHNLAKLDSNNQTTNLVSTHWLLSDIYSVLIV